YPGWSSWNSLRRRRAYLEVPAVDADSSSRAPVRSPRAHRARARVDTGERGVSRSGRSSSTATSPASRDTPRDLATSSRAASAARGCPAMSDPRAPRPGAALVTRSRSDPNLTRRGNGIRRLTWTAKSTGSSARCCALACTRSRALRTKPWALPLETPCRSSNAPTGDERRLMPIGHRPAQCRRTRVSPRWRRAPPEALRQSSRSGAPQVRPYALEAGDVIRKRIQYVRLVQRGFMHCVPLSGVDGPLDIGHGVRREPSLPGGPLMEQTLHRSRRGLPRPSALHPGRPPRILRCGFVVRDGLPLGDECPGHRFLHHPIEPLLRGEVDSRPDEHRIEQEDEGRRAELRVDPSTEFGVHLEHVQRTGVFMPERTGEARLVLDELQHGGAGLRCVRPPRERIRDTIDRVVQ